MAEQRHAVRPSTPTEGAVYGAVVATVEPFSIEHIPSSERHGKSGQLFLLWFAANLTIATSGDPGASGATFAWSAFLF